MDETHIHPHLLDVKHLSTFERLLIMSIQDNTAVLKRLTDLLNQAIQRLQSEPAQSILTAADQDELNTADGDASAAADAADAFLNPPPPAPVPAPSDPTADPTTDPAASDPSAA